MSVDLTLPATSSPAIDPYKDVPDPLLPFALYIHIDLPSEDELSAIENECNSQTEGSAAVERAPQHDLSGQPLRAALTNHLEGLSTRRHDPFYFVAVVDKNWREAGVILVTLDDGSDEDICHIDQMRVPAKEAGLVLVNLQLANVDWDEYKETYGDDQGDDDDDDDDDGDERRGRSEGGEIDEGFSDGASITLPNVGYWIGLYTIPEIDYETVMRALNPAWGPPLPSSELMCRPEGRVPQGSQAEAVAEAVRLHPTRCRNNPYLHRAMFLIVDTPKYEEEGILLVQMKWAEKEADNKDTNLAELSKLGKEAETDTQRLPFLNATTITIFNEIKAGYRPWKHTHKSFLAYAGPNVQYPSAYLAAVDKTFKRRKSGSERFLEKNVQFPLAADGSVVRDPKIAFETVLAQHRGFVHEERFRNTLCSSYFIFCDKELSSSDAKASLALVKVDRDASWSTMECAAGDAYRTLCDLADEKQEWRGVQVMPTG
ncbi:hypothetical protein F5Y10DRAFT_265386 [Nemania abortiva]|nr:hypothetical protein F5Y10DRAFT_265386 [Nemania abortiva]